MSIDQLDKIDIISTDPQGDVVLHISDHFDWESETDHILLLQDKINSYLQFIESGQIYEDYPNSINNKISIEVVFKFAPPESTRLYLVKLKEAVEKIGYPFSWRISPSVA